MYHHYLSQDSRDMPFFEPQPDHPQRYEDVRQMIMEKARTSPVFFKDMAYYIDDVLSDDPEFYRAITHCFLIRNPKASIASYYRLDNNVTLTEIGIEAQWTLYTQLVSAGIKPVVIEAEAIRQDARTVVSHWWHAMGLDTPDAVFEWDGKPPEDWQQVAAWHQSVMASTTIRPWSAEDAMQEDQRFNDLLTEAPYLNDYLEHHLPYYEKLKAELLS